MYKINVKIEECEGLGQLKDFIKLHNIRLVLFAETHGYFDELPIQRKVIEAIAPGFFLYEMLEETNILSDKNAKTFLGKYDDEDFSFISTYKDLKPTIRLARDFDLPIIGCDIKNMDQKSKDWLKKNFSPGEVRTLMRKRELRQAKVINQYTPEGLVFASLGAYHLRRGSITIKNLKEKKFILVGPSFRGKQRFLVPTNTKEKPDSYVIQLRKIRQ